MHNLSIVSRQSCTTQMEHLPLEVVEAILLCCSPVTVSAFAQTCRTYRRLVYQPGDSHFWRTLFLRQREYDDPRHALSALGTDSGSVTAINTVKIPWDAMLQRWVAAGNRLQSGSVGTMDQDQDHKFWCAVSEMIAYARPSHFPSSNLQTLERLFRGIDPTEAAQSDDSNSSIHDDIGFVRDFEQSHVQSACRLKVYLGWDAITETSQERLHARSFVYNLRYYRDVNAYGPFLPDDSGRVNWYHLFMVQVVIARNIMGLGSHAPGRSSLPMGPRHLQSRTPASCGVTDERDWAGITGRWQVIFCFCDHQDLIAFNRMNADSDNLDTTVFEDEDFGEATRFLDFELEVTHVEQGSQRKDRPKIHFTGNVTGDSRIDGQVYMTADNQIRWSFVSGEPGQAVWSTEAVQIGGVGSAYGALGTWTTVFHDTDDPVGPMWLYKHPVVAESS